MKKFLKVLSVAVFGLVLFAGCRTLPVYNVKAPIDVKVSQDKVYDAIKRAGYSKGWVISKVKPGLAMGRLTLRSHVAIVSIPYSSKEYSIEYKDSTNLKYNPDTGAIHKNYNSWVQNLDRAIRLELSMLN